MTKWRSIALVLLGVAGCTIPGPEDKAHDNPGGNPPTPIPVEANGPPLEPSQIPMDAFTTSVNATREGGDVRVRYNGALPSDGAFYFRASGQAADTLRLQIVDRNTSSERVSAVRPTSLSIAVPGVPASVTKVAVSGPSAGFGTITAPIQ